MQVVLCRLIEYSEHEKAYRFQEIKSGCVLIRRGTTFMEDVFDIGRRKHIKEKVDADIQADIITEQ